jgi:hypothetical protein
LWRPYISNIQQYGHAESALCPSVGTFKPITG